MMRVALPSIPQEPHPTGPEKKAQPALWSEVCGASIFSLTNDWWHRTRLRIFSYINEGLPRAAAIQNVIREAACCGPTRIPQIAQFARSVLNMW